MHQISIFTFSVAALMEIRWEPGVAKMPPSETKFFEISEPSWSRRADDKKATEAVARSLTKVILGARRISAAGGTLHAFVAMKFHVRKSEDLASR